MTQEIVSTLFWFFIFPPLFTYVFVETWEIIEWMNNK